MKNYAVRIYLSTFIDVEVEAEDREDAIDQARSMDLQRDEIFDNLASTDDFDIEEL